MFVHYFLRQPGVGTAVFVILLLQTGCGQRLDAVAKPPAAAMNIPATALPTATAVPATNPTAPPTATATVASTQTAVMQTMPTTPIAPTATAIPQDTATPTATAVPPHWLAYLNQFRQIAQLPPLVESPDLSLGSRLHSSYMAQNDSDSARYQDRENPHFTAAGHLAAQHSLIYATHSPEGVADWAVNYWAATPFQLVQIIDPQLATVGYGEATDAEGAVHMAAVLDVESALQTEKVVTTPVYFPAPGSQTWIIRASQPAYPDALSACPNFQRPTGPPIILQIGDGTQTPHVTAARLRLQGQPRSVCVFDETSYTHPDQFAQTLGREILNARDAVVLLPERPFAVHETYTVQLTVNGVEYDWSFFTVARPLASLPVMHVVDPLAEMTFYWPLLSHDLHQHYWSQHPGIDILTEIGSPVLAVAAGVVTFAGWDERGYGNLVILDHGQGVQSYYGHLDTIAVHRDEQVAAGETIGTVGNSGNSDVPHLHFELMKDYYRRVDPCDYLQEPALLAGSLGPGAIAERAAQKRPCGRLP